MRENWGNPRENLCIKELMIKIATTIHFGKWECIPRNEKTRLTYSGNVIEVANKFNEYFSSVGAKAAEESKALITSYGRTSTHPEMPHKFCAEIDKFHFHPVSCDVIRKIVYSFPSNKSPGPDKVFMKVIKDALPYILQPLTDIVNCSLRESSFPSAWKLSEVIPLLKKGDHEIAKNYRPISLLLAASKICERVVLEQFTAYVEQKKCLSVHQSGNRKHPTETLNLFISDKILKSMDDKEVVAVILLDLSKACIWQYRSCIAFKKAPSIGSVQWRFMLV